jgi:transposase
MLFPHQKQRIWLCTLPVDMRKSYDGLIALVMNPLRDKPTSGDWFVFINRRQTQLKLLYFEAGGYCLWCKRLEQGQFNFVKSAQDKQSLSTQELQWLVDGVEMKKIKQYKRYSQ